MKNVGQCGFDFGDDTPAFRASPVGTWSTPRMTFQQWDAAFKQAQSNLGLTSGFEHAVFEDALAAMMEEHAKQVAWCKYQSSDNAYTLWTKNVEYVASDIAQVIEHCRKNHGSSASATEYKVTEDGRGNVHAGMYVPGIGSVIAHRSTYRDGGCSLSFRLGRDTHFLDSYLDAPERVYCDQLVWERAYAGQALAESGDKIVTVKTFKIGARTLMQKAVTWGGDYCECVAYTLCPAADWKGDTFTYGELTKAWDDGSMGRGDSRGLLVKVNGARCVLEKYVNVYDDKPRTAPIAFGAEEEADDDIEDFEMEGDVNEPVEEEEMLESA